MINPATMNSGRDPRPALASAFAERTHPHTVPPIKTVPHPCPSPSRGSEGSYRKGKRERVLSCREGLKDKDNSIRRAQAGGRVDFSFPACRYAGEGSTRTTGNFVLSFICTIVLTGCMNFHVGTLPPPPHDAKLRVYVQPVSTHDPRTGFEKSHHKFAKTQYGIMRKYLEERGIYEVVPREDVAAVTGEQKLTRSLLQNNDWELARKIGKGVHADYIMIVERSMFRAELGTPSFAFTNILINTETGKKYGARYEVRRNIKVDDKERRDIIKKTYWEIFKSAKEDMLAKALRKAEGIKDVPSPAPVVSQKVEAPADKTTAPAPVAKQVDSPQTAPDTPIQTAAARGEPQDEPEGDWTSEAEQAEPETGGSPAGRHGKKKQAEPEEIPDYIKVVKEPEGLIEPGPAHGTIRLVVYDLEAPQQYKPAALIISDALREELFQFKNFTLVNRENLEQVLKEMALQQTGLVDEKEAVKMGKGLAANQVVTGRLGLLGKTIVMQAKRVDVETFATLGIASEKSSKGREEDIMEKLPAFAKQLTALKEGNK